VLPEAVMFGKEVVRPAKNQASPAREEEMKALRNDMVMVFGYLPVAW